MDIDLVNNEQEGIGACLCHLVMWWGVSLVIFLFSYLLLQPTACSDDDICLGIDSSISNMSNRYVSVGLSTLLLHESISLAMHYKSAQTIMKTLKGLSGSFVPSILICATFAVLLAHNLVFALSGKPWYAHAAAPGVRTLDASPVYTNVYIEWLINVPILLVIAGKCALGRPLKELARAVLVTNTYIITAWAANFLADMEMRWTLIIFTFAMYAFASWDMAKWVVAYLREAPSNLPSRWFRPWLTLGLVLVFGVYGIIYLFVFTGEMSLTNEKLAFLACDVGSKIVMSLSFGGIRGSEYHDRLVELLAQSNLPFSRQKNLVSDVCPQYERLIS
eukprot:TRINITY_DN21517_c0_g2_i1.p1 TRINITY_DN21517_c0_g2~~TRINITY_DN21517_c0_g2_i1.p1  ORF type:complete len:333 (-),score=36.95 TRINITY_DN21517_c0_g2_i1:343-1341(-)